MNNVKAGILIVDDNPSNINLLFDYLEDVNFEVFVAENGERALEQSRYHPPDLILLDVMMPGLDGFETCRRLKDNPTTKDIPVIFMTALADSASKMKGFAVGAVDYVTKPFEHQEVLARIQAHLALYTLQKQLEAQNAQLQQEIAEHKRTEEELTKYRDHLAELVAERTIDLQKEISERKRAEETLEQRVAQLDLINDIGSKIAAVLELDSLLNRAARLVQETFGYHHVALFLVDEKMLRLKAVAGAYETFFSPDHTQRLNEGINGWVAGHGEKIVANDVSAESRYISLIAEHSTTRAELCLPIRVAGQTLGVLDIQCPYPDAFGENDVIAMETLADQIAIAIENARLHAETEQRAEQLAVLHELDRAITASLQIDEVYHAFAHHFPRLLSYDRMSITLLEGDEAACVTYTFGGEGVVPPVGTLLPLKSSIIGWVTKQNRPLLLNDNIDDIHLPQAVQTTAVEIQSSMVIPLQIKGQVIGTWNIGNRQVGAYNAEDLKIAQSMADQLTIAIENASLHQQVQRYTEELEQRVADRTRELSALYEVTAVAGEPLDLQTTLERLLERVLAAMRSSMGAIHLLDKTGEQLHLAVQQGLLANVVAQIVSVPLDSGLTSLVIEHGEPLIVPDIATDPRTVRMSGVGPQTTYVGVPIQARGQMLGVLAILEKGGQLQFNVDEVILLTSIADHVGIVVESARLRQQAKRAAVMDERARLARDLHDSITQLLYSLTLFAKVGRESHRLGDLNQLDNSLTKIGKSAQQALKEMRLLVYELRPSLLEQDGLVGALQQRLDAVEGRANVKVNLLVDTMVQLPGFVEESLYYIAQEALNNTLKHATAGSVTVRICTSNKQVEMEVTDNGSGFALDALNNSGGLGLVSMRERAKKLGGVLTVLSTPEKGTTIKVSVETGEGSYETNTLVML